MATTCGGKRDDCWGSSRGNHIINRTPKDKNWITMWNTNVSLKNNRRVVLNATNGKEFRTINGQKVPLDKIKDAPQDLIDLIIS